MYALVALAVVLAVLSAVVFALRNAQNRRDDDRSYLSARLAQNAQDREANRRGGYYAILSRTTGTEPTVHTYLRRPCLAGDSDRFRARPWRRLSVRGVECGEEWRDRFAAM